MAIEEMTYAREPASYHCVIVNDDVDRAYGLLRMAVMGRFDGVTYDVMPDEDSAEREARTTLARTP